MLHDHLVIFLQVCTFNDSNDGADISFVGSITTCLDASSPSFVIVSREIPGVFLIAFTHEDFTVVFIALPNVIIFLELLIGLVIVGTDVCTVELTLYAKMVIGSSGKHTLSFC